MRLALWTPRPHAAWVSELLPLLRGEADVVLADGDDAPECDFDLYHVASGPSHVFVHRALRRRPGVVLLAEWSLHHLVYAETVGAGDVAAYLAEARRAHGERGSFVARQVARGVAGGLLPSLLTLNERALEASLGLVAFTEYVRVRATRRLPGRPVVRVPLDLVGLPRALPARAEARAALGVPEGTALVALLSPASVAAFAQAWPDGAEGVLGRASPGDEGDGLLLAGADVAVALEYPAGGGLPGLLVQALSAGVPTLVSAGSAAAEELEDGVVVKVSPGPTEGAETRALVEKLLADETLRRHVGRRARTHVATRGRAQDAAKTILALAREVAPTAAEARRAFAAEQAAAGTLLGWGLEEVRWGARDLGVVGLPLGLEPLLAPLLPEGR